ncbi:MAG: hypothetical protein LBG67_01255 [Campylobacteraceae bacterium]|jgi:hypothetical protein|nr:hypothetical protein [Campylobacteraceae bacterium]
MKKILLLLFVIFLCGCSNNLTKSNGTRYYFPQGFSIDFKGYENVESIFNEFDHYLFRGILLSNDDFLIISFFPFEIHKQYIDNFDEMVEQGRDRLDIYKEYVDYLSNEDNFINEMKTSKNVFFKNLLGNSTITKIKLNDGYIAYLMEHKSLDSVIGVVFKNSKFVVSMYTNNKDTINDLKDILHSIKSEKPKDKNYYLKQARSDRDENNLYSFKIRSDRDKDLLNLAIYYLYNPNDNEINEEILRILDNHKTLLNMSIQAIESRMNE